MYNRFGVWVFGGDGFKEGRVNVWWFGLRNKLCVFYKVLLDRLLEVVIGNVYSKNLIEWLLDWLDWFGFLWFIKFLIKLVCWC